MITKYQSYYYIYINCSIKGCINSSKITDNPIYMYMTF